MIDNPITTGNDRPMTQRQQDDFDAYYKAPNAREVELMRMAREIQKETEAKQSERKQSA